MTVSSQTNSVTYAGDGVVTEFAVPYYFLADEHLMVVSILVATGDEVVLVLNSEYTVTGEGNPAGGEVTTVVAPAIGRNLEIRRVVPMTQETDYVSNDAFPAESHERALDKLTMIDQQHSFDIAALFGSNAKTLRVPEGVPVIADAATRANMLLGFDGAGNPFPAAAISSSAADLEARLRDPANSLNGATILGYTLNESGAVGRTQRSRNDIVAFASDFGAVGNGVADDYPAINALLNCSKAVVVLDPGKTYRMTEIVNLGENVREIWGYGAKIVLTKEQGASFIAAINAQTRINPIKIHGLELQYTGTFNTGGSNTGRVLAIDINTTSGLDGVLIKDVKVYGFNSSGIGIGRTGVFANPLTYIHNVEVSGCNLSSNRVAGLMYGWVDGINIHGNTCTFNGLTGDTGTGYGIAGNSDCYPKNITVRANRTHDNFRKGIDFHAGFNINCDGNFAFRNGIQGIAFPLRNQGNGAFALQQYGNISVTNNQVGQMSGGATRAYGIFLASDITGATPFPAGSENWITTVNIRGNIVKEITSGETANFGIAVEMLSAANLYIDISDNTVDIATVDVGLSLNGVEPVHPSHKNKITIKNNKFKFGTVGAAFLAVTGANRPLMDIQLLGGYIDIDNAPRADGLSANALFSSVKSFVLGNVKVRIGNATYFNTAMWGTSAGRLTKAYGLIFNEAEYGSFEAIRRVQPRTGAPNDREFWELGSWIQFQLSTGVVATIAGWHCSTAGWAVNQAWAATTAYTVGTRVFISSNTVLVCTVAGTSGGVEPVGAGVDGTVTWAVVGAKAVFTTVNH